MTWVSSAPVLRPLGVGEILDAAFAVYRRNAFALWKLVAVVVALPAALNGVLAVAEQQVNDSATRPRDRSLVLQLLVLARQPDRVLPRDRGRLPPGRRRLPRPRRRPGRLAALRPAPRARGDLGLAARRARGPDRLPASSSFPASTSYVAWSVAMPALLGENLRGIARRSGARARSFAGASGPARACSCSRSCSSFIVALVLARRARRRRRLERQRHRALLRRRASPR